jgi:hypothetical protein
MEDGFVFDGNVDVILINFNYPFLLNFVHNDLVFVLEGSSVDINVGGEFKIDFGDSDFNVVGDSKLIFSNSCGEFEIKFDDSFSDLSFDVNLQSIDGNFVLKSHFSDLFGNL